MTNILPLGTVRDILSKEDIGESDIVARMLGLFDARHYDSPEAIEVLSLGLKHSSVLLRHEIAYVMGQMSQPCALPFLIELLDDKNEHAMVRHEAGEALAALGLTVPDAFECLNRNLDDGDQAVRETCELALIGLKRQYDKEIAAQINGTPLRERPKWDPSRGFYIFSASQRIQKLDSDAKFQTCDPVEGEMDHAKPDQIPQLKEILQDETRQLWDRYVAMFTLRNIGTDAAALALAQSLTEKSSALLRHELCFVIGQLQAPIATDHLVESLANTDEDCMVRHEAALSLGSVALEAEDEKRQYILGIL